ncbi:MAG: thioredoxin family protein [Thiothrix sp.]|uniref:thioredoxin family protein n=1 Tax=Thiothrix sp. TaxID=1032 RepID=UPI002636035C|nr:thioredoxin family protein [Thiothrix sp.]MDD5393206.1 thioredoxin family protein [Thiothrix sp.]
MKWQSGKFQLPIMTWLMLLALVGILGLSTVQLSTKAHAIEGDMVAQALQQGKPTIAEFGSDSCRTCQEMSKVLNQLEQDYATQLSVAHVNIVKEPDYAKQYHIMLMPTQVFFDANGQETWRHMGPLTQQEILDALGIPAGKS